MTTSKQVLGLYKSLLEKAYKFDNYNFREYAKRKVSDSFRMNKDVKDENEIKNLYNEGINQLAMLDRQTTISKMFTFDKLVVEPLRKHH
ncbi:Piso0_003087 [Millerozyma farinosa CBS 7064]|uniref:Piso0_003087 protein n=1 Tax=Pichia sorbitophila (strain ATCC MYA-4447 / BCRC 22081 / CBS 7064 / NBRC 10061 / NRRL Y-12695) TaxID=559304 RepID=G8YH57_PICSO|nr:Piso0_003087 [Millerozyma farinosa CBS 7064]CCE80759.1 Piso0_003087 [Millerozyma farinosa CBS 7064]